MEQPTTSPRKTLGTGLGASLTFVGVVLAAAFPLMGSLLLALAGLPAILIGLAWGAGWFGAYVAVLLVMTLGVVGPLVAVAIVPLLLVPTAVLVMSLRHGHSPFKAIAFSLTLATLFSSLLWLLAPLAGPAGLAIWKSSDALVSRYDDLARDFLQTFGKQLDEATLERTTDQLAQGHEMLGLLVPVTFVFLWHLSSLALIYFGSLLVASKFNIEVPALPPFRDWHFDWRLIWMFIAGWLLFNGAEFFALLDLGPLARRLGANCLAMSQMLYLIAGFSLIAFFFHKYAIGPGGRLGLTFLALMLAHLVIWLGILDVWADFRAPRKPIDTDSGESSFFDDW